MKKPYLFAFILLAELSVSACSSSSPLIDKAKQESTDAAKIEKAIYSLRKRSHKVRALQSSKVTYPDSSSVDLFIKQDHTIGFYYGEAGKAYSMSNIHYYCDLDKTTGEPTYENTLISPEETYFEGSDGYVYGESVSVENEVNRVEEFVKDDEVTDLYTPLSFDGEFKNPFDYISPRDVSANADGTLTLLNETADFLSDCYSSVGVNKITDNAITLDDDGSIKSIAFQIDDEVGSTYKRVSTLEVSYTLLEEGYLPNLVPYTHENPDLAVALSSLNGKQNYTYKKTFMNSDGTVNDPIAGYFTPKCVYFHHHDSPTDTKAYEGGDDYDYKAVLEDDNKYHAYEYSESGDSFTWNVVKLSTNANYVLDSFDEIAPELGKLSPAIFQKTGDYTYQSEAYFDQIIGQYVDYSIYGPDSQILETSAIGVKITLNEDKSIKQIETGFNFSGVTTKLVYTIYDIGTTKLPSWMAEAEE